VYNDGTRLELFGGTLSAGSAYIITIPVMSAPFSFSSNVTEGQSLTLTIDASIFEAVSKNLLAEIVSGDGPFVMAGAHLDSVEPGPGINDNGSGSSSILELAVNMADMHLENNVRFALWGAEELGLLGSEFYIMDTSQTEFDGIAMYLNFDMIGKLNRLQIEMLFLPVSSTVRLTRLPVSLLTGSANYMRGIFITTVDEELPIQQTFVDFFEDADLPYLPLDHPFQVGGGGRSDHAFFQTYGVPASGLFTGAEALKTEDLVALFGGTAGVALDACYHLECDTIDNINGEVLGQMAGAAAHALYTYADMPDLNLTALAMEITGPERRHKRRLVGAGMEREYPYDQKGDFFVR
jgi:Zn-dependent M28 family amino/carboxypeptidase